MKNKTKIIIPSYYFCAWNGGIDLIKHFINCLTLANKNNKYSIEILIPLNNFFSNFKFFFYPFFFFIKNFLKGSFFLEWPLHNGALKLDYYLKKKLNNLVKIKYLDYRSFYSYINKSKKNKQIIFPCVSYHKKIKSCGVGYIFDLQHEFLKKNFSNDEILFRKKNIFKILSGYKIIFVNSFFTLKCIKKIYKKTYNNNVFCIPFKPSLPEINFLKKKDILKKFKLTKKKYFIISNQFWKHKNHYFALMAYKRYLDEGGEYHLVLTGDYKGLRFRDTYKKIISFILKSKMNLKVIITGNINKDEQLALLYYSKCLIQPTLFEGGPGGGSSYDAISLGLPIILSDIEINKEIYNKNIFFFNHKKFQSLTQKLFFLDKKKFKEKKISELMKKNNKRAEDCGKYILNKLANLEI